jgi:hypothetical protein
MIGFGGKRRPASEGSATPARAVRCAVGRGRLRFAHPAGWVVRRTDVSLILTDAEPPAETCAIEVSILDLPPLESAGLTLAQLVARSDPGRGDGGPPADLRPMRRGGVEIVWTDKVFADQTPPLVVRRAWCYGDGVYAVFCYGFRQHGSPAEEAVWTNLLESIEIGPAPIDVGGSAGR